MAPKALSLMIGGVVLGLAAAVYLGLCGFLFVEQRRMIFTPKPERLDGPPAGSGYQLLLVEVPGQGTIKQWWAPPAMPGKPTVVFFHGNGGDPRSLIDPADALRRRGWGALLTDYPGYSGNPGKPSEAALMAGARAILAAVPAGHGPLIVWGHSLGSGVAARMASEGRAQGLVLEAPYTSILDLVARRARYLPVGLLVLDRFDTRSLLGQIHAPVLIFHGRDDPEIPFAQGRELADRLGAQATFVAMDGVGHYPHRKDLSDLVVRWAADRHIGD